MLFAQVKKALGWEPVVPLKDGLALMVEDFAHRLGMSCCCAKLRQAGDLPFCSCPYSVLAAGVPVKKSPQETLSPRKS